MKIKVFGIRRGKLGKTVLTITGLSLLLAQALSISPTWADGGGLEVPDLNKPPAEVQDADGDGNPFNDGGGYDGPVYESRDGFTWERTYFLDAGNGGFWNKVNQGE